MNKEELRDMRNQMLGKMEQKLHESWSSEEDSNSSDELEANMKKLKFVSHGFYDIYTEWMLLN